MWTHSGSSNNDDLHRDLKMLISEEEAKRIARKHAVRLLFYINDEILQLLHKLSGKRNSSRKKPFELV